MLLGAGCSSSPAPASDPPPASEAPSTPQPDAGRPGDAGSGDGGASDGGGRDAGSPDAGAGDGGAADAGPQGQTRWLHHPSEPKHEVSGGVAVSDAGSIFSVATHGVEAAYSTAGETELRLVVTRLEPDGRVAWTRAFPVSRPPPTGDIQDSGSVQARVAADAAGNVYLAGQLRGSVSFGGATLTSGGFLAGLTPAGEHRWSVALPAGYEVGALAADGAGNTYVGVQVQGAYQPDTQCYPTDGRVAKFDAQGARVWETSIGGAQCDGHRAEVRALSVDASGRVALGGAFSGELRFGEQRYRTTAFSPYLAVLGAQGGLAWLQPFSSASGAVTGVGQSAKGTVAATGTQYAAGHLDWAGTRLDKTAPTDQIFLLVAERDGKARWAKDLGAGERPVLAVEPLGSLVVGGLTRTYEDPQRPGVDPLNDPHLFASRFNLDGTPLWTHVFPRGDGRPDLFAEELKGAAMVPGGAGASVLAGQFSAPTDFGTGTRTPAETDVFVLRLAP
ncbi:hypothetical protein FGE12_02020 [Aggregicoccus sp. 17bor-14]|uniref:hypothetical protein n=1 Tax=Myxococcaceae TaxID=31 RepID=UPI00129C8194|nr:MULTISPECIES: hypothetical protein [Myxococcaceae]MBF5041151.1 hypothetical protein [Simulacricoccus sp. 17bor-14]MRI86938.1 hypothetical protein [Aggregicoccus sp. 17bor-14]